MTAATVAPSPDLIPRYCAWLASRRYSPQSIQGWRFTALRIQRAFPQGIPLDPALITEAATAAGCTVRSRRCQRTGANRFLEFLQAEGAIPQ